MSDITDVLYRLRNMAGIAADDLRSAIGEAQGVLDKLDRFAEDAQDGAELIAASDIEPNSFASIPERSGLARKEAPALMPEHMLTEDHNTDPVCLCGWNPADHRTKIGNREHGRQLVREHIRKNTPTPPRTTSA